MSSGDPLVDEEAQRLEALNSMLDSLASKDTLMLEAATTTVANGDDPLVDAEEEARKKRDDMLNSLSGKGKTLEAVDADDPLVAQDNQRDSERDQLIQQLQDKGESLLAQQAPEPKTVEEALRELNDHADADTNMEVARRATEADDANLLHKMEASGANRRVEANDPAVKTEASGFSLPDIGSWFKKGDKKEDGDKDRQLSATETDDADRRRALEANRRMEANDPAAKTATSDFGLPDVSSWSNWFKKDNKKDDGKTDPQLISTEADEGDRRRALEADEADRRRPLEADEHDTHYFRLEADVADRRRRHLEADGADRHGHGHNHLEADGAARPIARALTASAHSAHSSALDVPQMFGGAFILVAVVALVAVVRRRRKPTAASEPVDDDRSDDHDYQLFL